MGWGQSQIVQVNEKMADKSTIIYETIERRGPAMKKMPLLLITLLTFQQVLITPIPAQVYKYVDKNGVPHYTNMPNDPRYKKDKIGINYPVKKNRRAVKKSPSYKKPPHSAKSPSSSHPR
jgi:hypothetical protein